MMDQAGYRDLLRAMAYIRRARAFKGHSGSEIEAGLLCLKGDLALAAAFN